MIYDYVTYSITQKSVFDASQLGYATVRMNDISCIPYRLPFAYDVAGQLVFKQ